MSPFWLQGRIGRFKWGPRPLRGALRISQWATHFSGEMIRGARNATIVPHGKHLSIEPATIVFENIETNMKCLVCKWLVLRSRGIKPVKSGHEICGHQGFECSGYSNCLNKNIFSPAFRSASWGQVLPPRYIQTLVVRNLSTYVKRIRFQVPRSQEFRTPGCGEKSRAASFAPSEPCGLWVIEAPF